MLLLLFKGVYGVRTAVFQINRSRFTNKCKKIHNNVSKSQINKLRSKNTCKLRVSQKKN